MEETLSNSASAERTSELVLLPSHLFFVRNLALPPGINPEEVDSFVEVSLEQISPFTLNQLYYGHYLPPGKEQLLVFAAYRKQLAVYEDEEWAAADLVLPDFAAVLGLHRQGATLAFLEDEHDVTAVYWKAGGDVPERILSRPIESADKDGAELERVRGEIREELRRKLAPLPENVKVLTLERRDDGKMREKNLVFGLREPKGAERSTEIARSTALAMDVRDKAFLVATRKAQRQNRWIWAGLMLLCAGFITLGVFEAALFAGRQVLERREARVNALEPEVAKIMEEEELANRLEELSGERVLPFEMLDYLNQIRPRSVYFTRMSTDGLRSFEIDALTPRSQDVDRYQRLLEQADGLADVEIIGLRTRPDGRTSFSIAGAFSPGSLRAGSISGADENSTGEAAEVAAQPEGTTESAENDGEGESAGEEEAAAPQPPTRETAPSRMPTPPAVPTLPETSTRPGRERDQ